VASALSSLWYESRDAIAFGDGAVSLVRDGETRSLGGWGSAIVGWVRNVFVGEPYRWLGKRDRVLGSFWRETVSLGGDGVFG
jgi:hypothetical protein